MKIINKKFLITSSLLIISTSFLTFNSTFASKKQGDTLASNYQVLKTDLQSMYSDNQILKQDNSKKSNSIGLNNPQQLNPNITKESNQTTEKNINNSFDILENYGSNIFSDNFNPETSKQETDKQQSFDPNLSPEKYDIHKEFKTGFDKVEFWGFGFDVWVTKAFLGNVATILGGTSGVIGGLLTAIGVLMLINLKGVLGATFTWAALKVATIGIILSGALSQTSVASGTAASQIVSTGILASAGITPVILIANLIMLLAIITGILFGAAIAYVMNYTNGSKIGTKFSVDFGIFSTPITLMSTLREQNSHETTPRIVEKGPEFFYPEGRQTISIKADNDKTGFIIGDWRNLQTKFNDNIFVGIIDISKFTKELSHHNLKSLKSEFYFHRCCKTCHNYKLEVEFDKFLLDGYFNNINGPEYLFLVLDKKTESLTLGGSIKHNGSYKGLWKKESKFNFEDEINWNEINLFGFKANLVFESN